MTVSPSRQDPFEQDVSALPERLREGGLMLASLDVGSAVVLIALASLLHEARSAVLALTLLVTFAYWSGRYQVSFASVPRDELYSTLALAIEAALVLLLLVPLFQTSWIASFATLAGWTAVAAISAIHLTARRRGDRPRRSGSCEGLDAIGRVRTRNAVVRTSIAVIDVAIALAALVILSPLMLLIALAIHADDGRPVLFRQRRTGVDDREFTMYKFRTMRADADSRWATPGDERITRVGGFLRRTSLDELPQLWNVLKGEMSLVGPRPEMCEYSYRFARIMSAYHERHIIPPGITGWAQLHYPRDFQPNEALAVVPYDLFYVCNRSVSLYMFCLIKTIFEVLGHRAV